MQTYNSSQERIIFLLVDRYLHDCLERKVLTPEEAADKISRLLEFL